MNTPETFNKVFPKILRLLSLRPRTEKEISDKLKVYLENYNVSELEKEELTIQVLERLKAERFIDDSKYAKDVVFSVSNSSKPRGKHYVLNYLLKKGVSKHVAEDAVLEFDTDNEYDLALSLASKKIATIKNTNSFEIKRKIWSFLQYRGFNSDVIGRVIDNLLGVK